MPCSYFNISICSRGNGSNAVASAAYQSGEHLFDERSNKQKYYANKSGIVYEEILLPENAPEGFSDRGTLWNSVEHVEKQYNSQLARKVSAALPREIPREDQILLVRDYCQENFVSKGMCADIAIHDKDDGNPHVHIMLTMRPMDEKGTWMPKSRKVYDLDEDGNKIILPSGYYKSHKEKTTDWDEQTNVEKWRHSWEVITNQYLEKNNVEERLDMRSYERQGVNRIPEIHMGPAVYQMEKRGVRTFIGDMNRMRRAMNERLKAIIETIEQLLEKLLGLEIEMQEQLEAELIPPLKNDSPVTPEDYLLLYLHDRKKETGGPVPEKENVLHSVEYMRKHSICSFQDLRKSLDNSKAEAQRLRERILDNGSSVQAIIHYDQANSNYFKYKNVYLQYSRIFFPKAKEKFYQEHRKEIDGYRSANSTMLSLKNSYPDGKIDWKELSKKRDRLLKENKRLDMEMHKLEQHINELSKISGYIEKVRPKETIHSRLRAIQEQENMIRETSAPEPKRSIDLDLER